MFDMENVIGGAVKFHGSLSLVSRQPFLWFYGLEGRKGGGMSGDFRQELVAHWNAIIT